MSLVERYLRAFGPATPAEAADWAGLSIGEVKAALSGLELRRFRSEDGAELLDLPRLPSPSRGYPGAPPLLPVWDARCSFTPAEARSFPRSTGRRCSAPRRRSRSTFIVDGQVAGGWRLDKGRVELEPFGRLDKASRRELDEEGERLAAFAA